jgi:hypothetical protein
MRFINWPRPRTATATQERHIQFSANLPVDESKDAPMGNYYGLSQPVGDRMQYIRSFQDNTPITFRRNVNASGLQDVQIKTGVSTTSRKRITYSNHGTLYLSTIVPQIPGQMRDNKAGMHTRGIDPQSYAALWNAGPGAQPANPGGPGKIAAPSFSNPGGGAGTNLGPVGYGWSS